MKNSALPNLEQAAEILPFTGTMNAALADGSRNTAAQRKFIHDIAFSNLPVPFQKLQTYLWLMLLTRALGPAGFGTWSLFMVTLSAATTISTMNCGSSLMRFLSGKRPASEVNQAFSTVLATVTAASAILALFFAAASPQLAAGIFRSSQSMRIIALFAAALLFNSLFEEMKNILRARRFNRSWACLSLARLAPETIVVIFAALWLKNAASTVLAYVLVSIFGAFAGMIYLRANHQIRLAKPNLRTFVKYARYGVPLLPGVFASTISLGADKYVVAHYLGLKQVGIYTVCFAISAGVFFLTGPINDVLFPELSALYDAREWPAFHERFRTVQKFVLGFAVGMAAILVAFSRQALGLVAPPEFAAGSAALAVLGFQGIFMAFVLLYIVILNTRLRVWSITSFWVFSGAAIILIDVALVPRIGILGAAFSQLIATAAGAFVLTGLHWRLFRETFALKWLAQLFPPFISVCALALLTRNQDSTWPGDILILSAGVAVFIVCSFVTEYFSLRDLRGFSAALFERHA